MHTFLIVGGGGYIGYHIGLELMKDGHAVTLFDLALPDEEWRTDTDVLDGFVFHMGDVRNQEALKQAAEGKDCVVHAASFGMSSWQQLPKYWNVVEEVNIHGTKHVIEACCANDVEALVYTSTFNVVFGGQEIRNGSENLPYFPLHKHVDHYSRTKSIAEQLLIMADGKVTRSGKHLRTCSLRLAGVMGVKERRHLPRIVNLLRRGFLRFNYGQNDCIVEFVSIQNVVQAHVKAAYGLLNPEGANTIGGQSYFVSDGMPVNNMEFFRPLIEGLGYRFPTFKLPMCLLWTFVYIEEYLHNFLGNFFDFQPLLCKAELCKSGITHYFSIEKAKQHLNYSPIKSNDLSGVVEYYKNTSKNVCTGTSSYIKTVILFLLLIAALYLTV